MEGLQESDDLELELVGDCLKMYMLETDRPTQAGAINRLHKLLKAVATAERLIRSY
jgi:hypothetical protein